MKKKVSLYGGPLDGMKVSWEAQNIYTDLSTTHITQHYAHYQLEGKKYKFVKIIHEKDLQKCRK